jgi:hypothetical protein
VHTQPIEPFDEEEMVDQNKAGNEEEKPFFSGDDIIKCVLRRKIVLGKNRIFSVL